jgi:predicted HAD superfamily Cof-like phosphohydrolase|tara:strand:+ start:164 stop:550 length:387 start_codon:yes stop_codon:yes gene_type:complete
MKEMSVGESLSVFHQAFNCPRKKQYKKASVLDTELLLLRKNLIREEFKELLIAISNEPAENVLKELVDVVVVCVGMADTYGWDFDTAFARVHDSNMSKLDNDGKPLYRADGKVLKSENYKPPELYDLV